MKKNIIISALVVILAAWTLFLGYNLGVSHVYSMDNEYYNHTEALLDSINNWDESFMDTVMETDAYYEYEMAKERYTE